MSSYYIRPRQDFSLSTFAKILAVLEDSYKNPIVQVGWGDKDKLETWICFAKESYYEFVFDAVMMIVKNSSCKASDFKIVEVKE